MPKDKGYESLFASFGIAICLCTILVAVGKLVTEYYFFYLLIFLVFVTLVVFIYGHLLQKQRSVLISNEMKKLVSDTEIPYTQVVKKQLNERLSMKSAKGGEDSLRIRGSLFHLTSYNTPTPMTDETKQTPTAKISPAKRQKNVIGKHLLRPSSLKVPCPITDYSNVPE